MCGVGLEGSLTAFDGIQLLFPSAEMESLRIFGVSIEGSKVLLGKIWSGESAAFPFTIHSPQCQLQNQDSRIPGV